MARYGANPHVTGKDGGHSLNLHTFAEDGVTLLGRTQGVDGGVLFVSVCRPVVRHHAPALLFDAPRLCRWPVRPLRRVYPAPGHR